VPKRAWIISFVLAIVSATGANAATAAFDAAFDVRLIEPAQHAELVAGSTVSIAWEATNRPAGVEEWEAFLSINGGETYPLRLTPHLDTAIRRFTWTVPSLPGAEAAILLRFGDEHDERRFAFPARLRIVAGAPADPFRYERSSWAMALGTPEKNDHGETLVGWVEGSRDGSRLRQVVAHEPLLAPHRALAVPAGGEDSAFAAGGQSSRFQPATLQPPRRLGAFRRDRRLDAGSSPDRRTGVLVLSCRLNI